MDIDRLFNGRPFDREVIVLCVRWYLRHKLSLRWLRQVQDGGANGYTSVG